MALALFFLAYTLGSTAVWAIQPAANSMAAIFFKQRAVRHVCYLSCEGPALNAQVARQLMALDLQLSVGSLDGPLERRLNQWSIPVGVLADDNCKGLQNTMEEASRAFLFDASHPWLVVGVHSSRVDQLFGHLNLSVDADITYAECNEKSCTFTDVFNFGKIQGNALEKKYAGTWDEASGLELVLQGFKYYHRWDFHNLTLRAVTVVLDRPQHFNLDEMLSTWFTSGVSAMTKISAQLLHVVSTQHNFRFNFTITDLWAGTPSRNSTLAVTNSLFWREQDLSYTCLRTSPERMQWVEPFFPPVTTLETRVFYLISEHGIGDYENRFIQPLSSGAWACASAAGVACAVLLAAGAALERRPGPAQYGIGSVLAAACQQAYEDGVDIARLAFDSQSRKIAALALGLMSMLLYNYYTSSVVSWLLNASPPTIASLDELIRSPYELIFEDIGYTRSWLDDKGLSYYSGYKNPKEDKLKETKVLKAKRTVPLMQTADAGVELIRTGAYAYHSEPYSVSRQLSRLSSLELCKLGVLQMMPPSPVYIMGQHRGPYRQFFTWSLMRLEERGHGVAVRARIHGRLPKCSGGIPRALPLGQAAPAFVILAEATVLALVVLIAEIWYHRWQKLQTERLLNKRVVKKNISKKH